MTSTAAGRVMHADRNYIGALWDGVTAHLWLRYPNWIMSALIFCIGVILYINPHIFSGDVKAYQYVYLNRIIHQEWWAAICMIVGAAEILALIVNGTFPSFTYSAHLRTIGAALACFVWINILFGVMHAGELTTAQPIYVVLLLFDSINTCVAVSEIPARKVK